MASRAGTATTESVVLALCELALSQDDQEGLSEFQIIMNLVLVSINTVQIDKHSHDY